MDHHTRTVDVTKDIKLIRFTRILSPDLLMLTKRTIKTAQQKEKRALKRETKATLHEILGVYIMVAASLEAFINEFIHRLCEGKTDYRQEEKPYWLNSLNDFIDQKVSLEMKWQLVPQLLWQKKFDEGQEPWQSFKVLVNLRNALLHYKMEMLPPEKLPNKKLRHIQHLLLDQQIFWVDRVCSLELAKWAYNTGVSMIMRLLEFSDSETRDYYTWLFDREESKLID